MYTHKVKNPSCPIWFNFFDGGAEEQYAQYMSVYFFISRIYDGDALMNEAVLFPFAGIDLILISVRYRHVKTDQKAFIS